MIPNQITEQNSILNVKSSGQIEETKTGNFLAPNSIDKMIIK